MGLITMAIRMLRILIVGLIFSIGGIVLMDLFLPRLTAYHPFLVSFLLITGAVGLNQLWIRRDSK